MAKRAIPADDRWINSDSQILGRVKQSKHKQGILCSVTMPWGGECQAVVEKWDANSAIQYCELVRSTYDARREEQEAKQASKAASRPDVQTEPDGGEKLTSCEVSVTPPEETVSVDFTDRTSVSDRIDRIRDREVELNAESNRLRVERTKLSRILDVLDSIEEEENASQDDGQVVPSVPTKTPSGQEAPDGVDRESHQTQPLEGGEADSGEYDSEV
jgi:hypothetical protein